MQTKNLVQYSAIASVLLFCGWIILVSSTIPQITITSDKKTAVTIVKNQEELKIFTLVKTKEIKEALAKSKEGKIILNIYPLKLTNDLSKTDFYLQVFYQDAAAPGKNLGKTTSSNTFKTQSKNYISFLKAQELTESTIPYGYYIDVNPLLIKHADRVNICVTPRKSGLEYCLLPPAGQQSPKNKFDGKCPPDCCSQFQATVISSDSTIGKCPPNCKMSLLFGSAMKKVISSEFKNPF